MLGVYCELIALNELLSVFDIQKRDVYAAEAQFFKKSFFQTKVIQKFHKTLKQVW